MVGDTKWIHYFTAAPFFNHILWDVQLKNVMIYNLTLYVLKSKKGYFC